MLAILEPFCPSTVVGTARTLSSGKASEQDTVIAPVEQVEEQPTLLHPLTGLVAEPEAKQVILEMLHLGVPESVVCSIFDTGYYEVVIPSEPADVPYIAITYTNDIEEGHVYDLNSHPPQNFGFLMTPQHGMTADDRGEWEDEESWDGFQWGSLAYYQDSGEVDSIPRPVLYTISEFEDLEPVSGLQIYFGGCDDGSLNLCSTRNRSVDPWYTSKSTRVDRWSEDYDLGDVQNLIVADEGDALEQDSSDSSNSSSDLGDSDMDWTEGTETELAESEGEEVEGCA